MFKVYDVKCPKCGSIEEDVLLEPDEAPGVCPECGYARNVLPFGKSTNDDAYLIFRPIDLGMGKVLETKEEYTSYMAELKSRFPDAQGIDVRGWDRNEAKSNADDRRHAAWLRRKARGVGDAEIRERAAMPRGEQ